MATSSLLVTTILATLFILQAHGATTLAPAPAATSVASKTPPNLTSILQNDTQFSTFIRLLVDTQIAGQIDNQLNNSFGGMTVFAPTDNAFSSLKAGTLNDLSPQQHSELVLFHVVPRYYSRNMLGTLSNPITTLATGNNGGLYSYNITSNDHQVNISTGVNDISISNTLYSTFPLAVYDVDSVLLPYDIFGHNTSALGSPLPAAISPEAVKRAPSISSGNEASAETSSSSEGSLGGRMGPWMVGILVGVVGMVLV